MGGGNADGIYAVIPWGWNETPPYDTPVRRSGTSFDEAYDDGKISHFAKRIYDVVAEHGTLPLHGIKQIAGFTKEDKSGFDRAITELQMKMFLGMADDGPSIF